MMHVDRQGDNECALATMAALAGISLAAVRGAAIVEANVVKWQDTLANTTYARTRFHHTMRTLAHRYGGKKLLFHMDYGTGQAGGSSKVLGNKIRKLPAKGRGTVRICKPNNRIQHIAPWENGLVYDPECPKSPMTLKQFRQKCGNVKRITCEGTL